MENSSELTGKTQIACHIRQVYQANADARSTITESLRIAKLAADAEYDPSLIFASWTTFKRQAKKRETFSDNKKASYTA